MERNKIISITNSKGGVGKTTTTLNMGAWLSKMAKLKILLIDGDGQANLTTCFNLQYPSEERHLSLYDLLTNEDVKAIDVICHDENGVCDVIPADERLNSIDMKLSNELGRETILSSKLEEIRQYYDFIIIDCCPSFNLTTYNALTTSDFVIIPVQSDYLAVRGTSNLNDNILKVQKKINPKLQILGYFLTMYDNRITNDKSIFELFEEEFGDKIFQTKIRENSKLKESPMYKKNIFDFDMNSNGCFDYHNLMIEIWKRLGGSVGNGK